jgi:hypothetical protein
MEDYYKMVHKSSFIPGLSKFIDESVLSHYPATSMKRILMAGAVSIYLKQSDNMIDTLASNPLFTGLGVMDTDGNVNIEVLRDALKSEINKAGFMRLSLPMIGDIDFTPEDVDTLYKFIVEADSSSSKSQITSSQTPLPLTSSYNGGVY